MIDRRGLPSSLLRTAARLLLRIANDLRSDGPSEDVDELRRGAAAAQRIAKKIQDQGWKTTKRGRTNEGATMMNKTIENKKAEDVPTKELTEAEVETWALANPHDAKAFGMRLVTYASTPDKLDTLPSLGKFQDRMTAWAKRDPAKAKEVLMKLFPKIMLLTAGGKK